MAHYVLTASRSPLPPRPVALCLQASAQDITQRVNAAAHVTGGVDVGVTARARVWLINPFVRDRGVPKFAPIFAQVNTVTDNTCTFTPRVVRNAVRGCGWGAATAALWVLC